MPDSTPQSTYGKVEEGLQREVYAPRKPAKVSFWEVEEEKTRDVVDEMKPDAQIPIQSQRQEPAEVEQRDAPEQLANLRAEGLIDGGTKRKSGGSNLEK